MGKFEIFKGKGGNFFFHLKAANGQIIAASEGYTTKQSAQEGINAVKLLASAAPTVDLS